MEKAKDVFLGIKQIPKFSFIAKDKNELLFTEHVFILGFPVRIKLTV